MRLSSKCETRARVDRATRRQNIRARRRTVNTRRTSSDPQPARRAGDRETTSFPSRRGRARSILQSVEGAPVFVTAALLEHLRQLSADPDRAEALAAELSQLGVDVTAAIPSALSVSIVF